jgi:hypothetical protein
MCLSEVVGVLHSVGDIKCVMEIIDIEIGRDLHCTEGTGPGLPSFGMSGFVNQQFSNNNA